MAGNKKATPTAKPAKGAEKDKVKAKGGSTKDDSGGKLKPATAINTRHVLVLTTPTNSTVRNSFPDCDYSVRSIPKKKKPSPSCRTAPNSMMWPESSLKIKHGKEEA